MLNVVIVTFDSNRAHVLFIRDTSSLASYSYRSMVMPNRSFRFLQQANAQGKQGRRLKMVLNEVDETPLLIYIRDRSQKSANYTYRHGPCVPNREEFYQHMNQYAADGYRFQRLLVLDNFCFLYIKDRSINATFHYESIESFNSSEDFVVKGNALGARGYRLTETKMNHLKASTSSDYDELLICYRDLNQPSCKFSYSVERHPNGVHKMMNQLLSQGKRGFFLVQNIYLPESDWVNIYVKMYQCQYESLNIDDHY